MSDEFNFEQFNFEPGECQDTPLGLVTLPPISGAEGGPPSCPCGWGPNGIPQTNSLGIYVATWPSWVISTNPVIYVEHTHPTCMTWYDYNTHPFINSIPMNPCWQEYLTMPFCIDHANGNNLYAAIGAGWANCRLASDLQAMTNAQRKDIFDNTYSNSSNYPNPSHTLGVHPGTPPMAWIPVFVMDTFGLPSNQPNPLPPHQNGGWAVPAMRWIKIDATGSMGPVACFLENLACPNTCLGCTALTSTTCITNPGACQAYDPTASYFWPDLSAYPTVGWPPSSMDCCVSGCTTPGDPNYNPLATCDDGSCQFYYGCTDPQAYNYGPTANIDDGSCLYPTWHCQAPQGTCQSQNDQYGYPTQQWCANKCIVGCTNPLALNYDPNATIPCGPWNGYPSYLSCCNIPESLKGCMDSNAINYMDCCDLTIPGCVPTIQYDACCKYEDDPEKTKCHCCNKFGQAVMPNNNDYTDCSTLDGTLNTPATGMYNCVPVSQTLNCETYDPTAEGQKNVFTKETIEYDKKISEDTRDGVYFTPSGEEWSGPTHRMPGGMLMSGNPHDIDGSGLEGRSEILTVIYTVYLTPSGKQWCGDMHESMLGTLMSGRARDVFGSGPDGKSELLSKNTIKNSLSSSPYKSCKTDEPKPSWDCTSIGCMLLPPSWPYGQFTGPNAYVDCMNVCKSWLCASFVLFPPFNFEFCLCAPVQGTGATQTYPTQALCLSATTTDPCCTDDYNTYNCTINGCEVHTGPGFGTYNQTPYALYECQQDCVAYGCYDVVYSSAHTTTGYSYTDDSTAHTYTLEGWTVDQFEYEWTSTTATTLTAEETDICIEAWYDITSMNSQTQQWAEDAIDQWMIDEAQPGGMLEFWTGTFLNHRQVNFNTQNGMLGEKYFRWPEYTLDAIDIANTDIPGTNNPNSPCRNVFVIAFIDESNNHYYSHNDYWVNNGPFIQGDITDYMNKHVQWTSPANGGTLQFLVYPARSCGALGTPGDPCPQTAQGSGRGIIKQLFQITQGWKLNTGPPTNPSIPESGNNVLTYANGPVWGPSSGPFAPINGNIYEITDYAGNPSFLYGNPGQFGLPGIFNPLMPQPGPTPGIGCNSFVYLGCPDWHVSTVPLQPGETDCSPGAPSNPYTPMDDFGYNDYLMMEPLENYNVWGQYDRRQTCPATPGVWSVDSIGPDLNMFMMANVMTGTSETFGVIITNLGPQWTSTTVTLTTASTYTGITSNTVTVWWTGHECLSAETIQTPDYPYLDYNVCMAQWAEKDCEWPGISCGIDGCHPEMNGTWVDDIYGLGRAACEQECRQWSCVTKTGGLQPEGGWPQLWGFQTPLTCEGTMEDANGVTFSLHQPITGGTYDFVEHCFGIFQPSTIYQPNIGLILGGLWDNTGTSWVQGVATTTIENGLVVNDMGGGNCKTWHPDYPNVPGRITKLSSFRLVDLNGNIIYEHGGNSISALDIMNELANGVGYGWSNAVPTPLPPFALYSPDWPNGMPSFVVGPGIALDQLIAYGNNISNNNDIKEFTVEVDVFGCPCGQICYCELVPGIDTANTTTWSMTTPNAWQLCTDECCEKTKTWKCPDLPEHRHLICNNCPNGGGCYDPLDGSGLHSTQSLCEDDCAVSYNCFSATPISAVTTYSANTTCEHVDYTMVNGQYLYLLPYSGIPVSYFQGQEPIGTQNGNFTVAQNNFSGWTWGRWSDIFPATNIIKEAFKFNYGAAQGANFGGISNAFEAFIYIFDERKGYHNTEFNKMGFWTGNLWDNDTTHTCEYPSPQGDKELGVMDGFRNNEFSTMFCIDYEIRHNKRPWVATLDPLLNGVPHPYAVSHDGKYWVQGASTMCGRDAGEVVQYNSGPPDYLSIDNQERYITHGLKDGSAKFLTGGSTRSKYKRYTFKSVKDLKEKIHWMYSQPDYVDTYGWSNLSLYEYGSSLGQSPNETNLQSGACTRLGRDLARLYNPGPMMSLCTDLLGNNYTVPHPSNGLKDTTTTIHGLQLKDFWSIGMFRNRHPGAEWRFTPFMNYWEFERAGETGLSIAYNNSRCKYNSFMTLGPGGYNLYPGVTSLGIYAYSQYLGPSESYGLMGRSVSIFGNIAASLGYTYVPDNSGTNYLGPVLACQCEMPCYCDIINGDLGDYEYENQCHSNCCPDYYYSICCQPDTNPAPTSIPPFQVSCLYSITNCQCPTGSHQVACPWIVGGGTPV